MSDAPFFLPGRKLAKVDPKSQGIHRETCMMRVSKPFALWLREESKRQTKAAEGKDRVTVTDVTTQLYLMLNEGE